MTDCPRHGELCAYTGTEPDRCPTCHTTWEAVRKCKCTRCRHSVGYHHAVHERSDQREAEKAARNRLRL